MEKLINAYLWLKHLPITVKKAGVRIVAAMIGFSFILASMDMLEKLNSFDGFWKIRAVVWILYYLFLGQIIWRVYGKWRDGSIYEDEE